MSYDEQPDGDVHGECAVEIARLTRERDEARAEIERRQSSATTTPETAAIIECLQDDAAALRDRTPDCEIAQNMDDAAGLIESLVAEVERLREDAERYGLLRNDCIPDVGVVRGFDAVDIGSSGVAYTYLENLDGEKLDTVIDAFRGT